MKLFLATGGPDMPGVFVNVSRNERQCHQRNDKNPYMASKRIGGIEDKATFIL